MRPAAEHLLGHASDHQERVGLTRHRRRSAGQRRIAADPRFTRRVRIGTLLEHTELASRDQNSISVVEHLHALDAHAVHVHAVGAQQVLDENAFAPDGQLGVVPRDQRIVENHIAIGCTSDDEFPVFLDTQGFPSPNQKHRASEGLRRGSDLALGLRHRRADARGLGHEELTSAFSHSSRAGDHPKSTRSGPQRESHARGPMWRPLQHYRVGCASLADSVV